MQYKKTIHAALRRLLLIFLALLLPALSVGCESVTPRPDISVNEMEQI